MKIDQECFADLALGYIQGTLKREELQIVHALILESPEFLGALKEEISLKKSLDTLRHHITSEQKKRVYQNVVITGNRDTIFESVAKFILEASLPPVAWPALKLFQRSVLANE